MQLFIRSDSLVSYTTWLRQLEIAMNNVTNAQKMLAMCQPERHNLPELRQIFLTADMDIPRSHVGTTRQRYITLCKQLGKVHLLGMSYPLLAYLT